MESQLSSQEEEEEENEEQCEEELAVFSRFILNGVDDISGVEDSGLNPDLQKLILQLHEEQKKGKEGAAGSSSTQDSTIINELVGSFAPSSLQTVQQASCSREFVADVTSTEKEAGDEEEEEEDLSSAPSSLQILRDAYDDDDDDAEGN